MAIARCDKHTPDGTKHAYKAFALPLGTLRRPPFAEEKIARPPRAYGLQSLSAPIISVACGFRYPHQFRENSRVGRANFKLRHLSLPEIKSGRIHSTIRPGSAGRKWGQPHENRAKPAHPCSAISACEPRCNIFDTISGGGEGAARQTRRRSPGIPA